METKERYSLIGIDSNAFAIIGYVQRAMQHEKFTKEEIDAYIKNATSSDYYHLIAVSQEQIEKCNNR